MSRNYLAESYAFFQANWPKAVADFAVPFDRITAVQQPSQFRK
jgi:hypothetical protein